MMNHLTRRPFVISENPHCEKSPMPARLLPGRFQCPYPSVITDGHSTVIHRRALGELPGTRPSVRLTSWLLLVF